MAGAVSPALAGGWLGIDTEANAGSGRLPHLQDSADSPAPAVTTGAPAITADMPDVAAESGGVLHEPSHWTGAWPSFTQGGWAQGPAGIADGAGNGEPDTQAARLASPGTVRVSESDYAGHDAHSQMTDTLGWDVTTPTGRTAARRLLGASGDGFADFWWGAAERPAPKRFALTGGNGDYADTASGGPGNIAYATPGPPETVAPPQGQGGAPDWQWGGF